MSLPIMSSNIKLWLEDAERSVVAAPLFFVRPLFFPLEGSKRSNIGGLQQQRSCGSLQLERVFLLDVLKVGLTHTCNHDASPTCGRTAVSATAKRRSKQETVHVADDGDAETCDQSGFH